VRFYLKSKSIEFFEKFAYLKLLGLVISNISLVQSFCKRPTIQMLQPYEVHQKS
jgi:hypothetical protein